MEAIYINQRKYIEMQEKILNCSSNIKEDVNRINELLDDLKNYWIGLEARKFNDTVEEYNVMFNNLSNTLNDYYDVLNSCLNRYLLTDEEYSNESL